MRLLHVVAFSKKLRWLAQTKVLEVPKLHAVSLNWNIVNAKKHKCDLFFGSEEVIINKIQYQHQVTLRDVKNSISYLGKVKSPALQFH